ncbi:MAG: DUF1858 domain-containing protein [Candidatus Nanoarchaeia archaeon]|nr:DUF1858 domain-containing protein [Candidatus Nanoarchaeia archaeon]
MENKKEKKNKITKDMNIIEMVQKYPQTVEVLFKHGFHCVGCAMAHYESIEQAAEVHGIDLKKLLNDLNKVV